MNATSDQARRVFNVGVKIAERDSARGKTGDLFALQEAHYEKKLQLWPPTFGNRLESRRITCPDSGQLVWTAECLFSVWKTRLATALVPTVGNPVQTQTGDCAVLGHDRFISASMDHVNSTIGRDATWGENQRFIVGARFLLTGGRGVLPFYSVHVVPKSGGPRQVKQCIDVVRIVHDNFLEGDLTPLVVGDFNFSRAGDPNGAYPTMDRDFYEAGDRVGESAIEHCWVGRESSFPSNGGVLRLVEGSYEHNRDFDDGGANLTDHPCPYVEFELPEP
jgi:hypothetical protein